jgi:hypothetical protein
LRLTTKHTPSSSTSAPTSTLILTKISTTTSTPGEFEDATMKRNLPLILGITIPAVIILAFLGIAYIYFFKRLKGSNLKLDESIDLNDLNS